MPPIPVVRVGSVEPSTTGVERMGAMDEADDESPAESGFVGFFKDAVLW